MPDHEHFETFCALVVTGQLAGGELLEFTEHCESCSACRHDVIELAGISSILLSARHQDATRIRAPDGMYDRFVSRWQREGIRLRYSPQIGRRAKPIFIALTMSLALLIGFLLLFHSSSWTPLQVDSSSLRERQAAPDQSMLKSAPNPTTADGGRPEKSSSRHVKARQLKHRGFFNNQGPRLPQTPLLAFGQAPGLRFYVPTSRGPAYPVSGTYPWSNVAAAYGRNSTLIIRPFAAEAEAVFRLDPQLMHVAYVSHPPDFIRSPRPLTFQLPVTQ